MLPVIQFLAISAVGQAFAVRFVFQRLRGDRPDLGRSIAVGMKNLGVVAGIDLLLSAPQILYLFIIVFETKTLIEDNATGIRGGTAGIGALGALELGSIAIALFLFVVQLVFPVAAPAAVVESRGVFASFRRSATLTKGSRSTIFGVYFIYGLILMLPAGGISFIIETMRPGASQFLARSAHDLLLASLTCVLPIVLYHELRDSKEGIGIEDLAAVFD
jgi:hypothetical protein